MNPSFFSSSRLCACLFLLASTPCAQGDPTPKPAAKPEWPKLDRLQTGRVEELFKNLTLKNQELHEESLKEMVALGAGTAPALLGRFSDAKTNHNAWLERALDGVTAVEHTPLLAIEATSKVVARRRYVVRRLGELAAPGMAETYRKAMADKDADVAFFGGLSLASTGDATGLPVVLARAKADWKANRALIEKILPHGKGGDVSRWLSEQSEGKDFAARVAALRLFRSGGAREHAARVASSLDASDNLVKKEAINALRVVVLGQEPLEDLSVFQAIEMAKEIRSKL